MSNLKDKLNCHQCENKPNSIFCALEQHESIDLSKVKIMNIYKKGQTLFHEGTPPFGLYCINTGKIKVTKASSEGKDTITRIASEGDMLGYQSLFHHPAYKETATAIEDSKVCFIDKKHIMKLVEDKSLVAMEVIAHLGKQMGQVEEKLAHFFQKNVRERLAQLLLDFESKFGVLEEDGRTRLNIKLTREEMASLVGVATETLIRFISEFKEYGAIEQEGKTIFIRNPDELRRLANNSSY